MTIVVVIPWVACVLCETAEHVAYRMGGRAPVRRLA